MNKFDFISNRLIERERSPPINLSKSLYLASPLCPQLIGFFLVIYCGIFDFKADSKGIKGGFGAFHCCVSIGQVWFPWLSYFQFLWETQIVCFLVFVLSLKREGDFSQQRKWVSVSHFQTPQVTSLSLNLMYNSLYLFIIIVTYNL